MVTLSGCPACDERSSRHRYTKFGLSLVQCLGCGLVYANPRLTPEEIWQRYSPDYFWNEYLPALGVRDGQYDLEYFDRRHAAMLRLLETYSPRRGRLLEVGAGAGFFLKAAERSGWQIAGVEVSHDAVAFATGRLNLDVRQEPAETMTFEPGSFDVAVLFDVIEHLLDPVVSLRQVRSALRSDGVLVVSTPNLDALSRWALGAEWAVLSPAEHLYNFSTTTLRRVLERAGFSAFHVELNHNGFGLYETMNPRYTHAPTSFRARAYRSLVSTVGRLAYRQVQKLGKADTLLMIAR